MKTRQRHSWFGWFSLALAAIIASSGCAMTAPAGAALEPPAAQSTVLPTETVRVLPLPVRTATAEPSAFATVLPSHAPSPFPTALLSARPELATPPNLADLIDLRELRLRNGPNRVYSSPTPTPDPRIPTYPPNTTGDIPVLMYHRIGYPEDTWTRTPESFRSDLEFLVSHGFYPVNLIDVVLGRLDQVPVGRRPVVLTFDDSTAGQFWLRDDGTVDPDCAIGILLEMHRQYGTDWPLHATFFVITPLDQSGSLLFGQTTSGPQKVRQLIEWGMEVGSHTVHHPNLRVVDSDVVQWELAVSQHEIEAMVPGYSVTTLALPEGGTPQDDTLLARGYSEAAGLGYRYLAAVKVGAGPAPSPLSPDFDAYRIPRIRASQDQLDVWFPSMAWSPDRYYVSDGVPRTITGTQ